MSIAPPTPPIAPAAPDRRSKGIAVTALVLSIVGLLVSLVGFLPIAWVGIIGAALAAVVLLAAFVLAIVGLVGSRNGGKPLSVVALVVSVLGGIVVSFALIVALVFTGLWISGGAATPSPAAGATDAPTAEATDGATDEPTDDGAALDVAEQAFVDDVRPQVEQIMQQVDPTLTPELVEQAFPDESLLMIGQALLATGEAGIDSFVDQTLATAGDTVSADQLRELYQAIYDAAVTHLQ
ncbi:MAG TPA: hypothetical protein VEP72_07495 [Microbacterium sp.]|nr:hypothetical protein [Microbacterium sp.]